MQPALWGPGVWHIMFVCAYNATSTSSIAFDKLCNLILQKIPLLIPCGECRRLYREKHKAAATNRMGTKRLPTNPHEMLYWLYLLRDEVNKSVFRSQNASAVVPNTLSPTFKDVSDRFLLKGNVVDAICVGDTLVLLAIAAKELKEENTFIDLCVLLQDLLPLPKQSAQLQALRAIEASKNTTAVVAYAYRVCRATRSQYACCTPRLQAFRILAGVAQN